MTCPPTNGYSCDLSSVALGVLFILIQQCLSAANCTAVFAAPHCWLDVAADAWLRGLVGRMCSM